MLQYHLKDIIELRFVHLAAWLGAPLFVGPWDQLCVFRHRSILGSRCHGFKQSDSLTFGPATSDPFPDRQRRQRVGESVGGLHGPPAGLGGRHREDL